MSNSAGKRKRSVSLRTQMFNKHLYDKFNRNKNQNIELDDIQENGRSDSANDTGDDDNEIYNEIYEDEDADGEDDEESFKRRNTPPGVLTRILDGIFNRTREIHTKDGRHIPIVLDHDTAEYKQYSSEKENLLVDERLSVPYCNNKITSSRYSIYTFFPRQIYAQFSKLANAYFFLVAILQMIPGWSTTGTYTTIIPLCVFMGISMAREAWDDFRRHRLDKEENEKRANVLTKVKVNGSATLNDLSPSNTAKRQPPTDFTDGQPFLSERPSFTRFSDWDMLKERHGVFIEKRQWRNLRVGDFVLLKQDDWVPADILLLACDGENNECYVETMALDGETNLKSRQPHPELSKLACSASGLANINAKVTVEDPNLDLYNFEGNLELQGNQNGSILKYPLGPDNVIYRGSVVRNTQNVVGMIVFTGEETKIRMNALKNPRVKAPKLQRVLNLIICFMVFVVACISFFSYFGHVLANRKFIDHNQAWYLLQADAGTAATIMSFIIMYNTMIPLSLYVTMEIIKVMQCKLMEWDIDMYHAGSNTPCEARTATILEELGQVSYIFSDKTGTLTENKMIFRKFSFCGTSWIHEVDPDDDAIKPEASRTSANNDIEVISYDSRGIANQFNIGKETNQESSSNNGLHARKSVEYKGNSTATYTGRPSMKSLYGKGDPTLYSKRKSEMSDGTEIIKNSYELIQYIQLHPDTVFSQKARFFILSLSLCHTCLPKRTRGCHEGEDTIEYQSSSPDELALVTAARDLGYMVLNKHAKTLTIKSFPNGFDGEPQLDDYEILQNIEFNSHRKRMSVLVRIPTQPDKVLLICKGADNVILERLSNRDVAFQKLDDINTNTKERKDAEAELVIQQRLSLERLVTEDDVVSNKLRSSLSSNPKGSLSLQAIRKSMSRNANGRHDPEMQVDSIDQFLNNIKRNDEEIGDVINESRKSLHKQQLEKYGSSRSAENGQSSSQRLNENRNNFGASVSYANSMANYIGSDELILNEEYVIERTLQAIDEFSTEGLRTLLYGYKWINSNEYEEWEQRYHQAKTSLTDRRAKIDEVGGEIENELFLVGATAIEDKLQEGVADSIEKIRRAGIHMWMLTGDKRETAINIGYSCKLIYDYSTVVILTTNDENIISKMNAVTQEIESGNIAHCVIVIDGATLGLFESNPTLMSVFIELCTKTDSVICCRASPSQKALMVTNIRNTRKDLVTLAIGDGANDIAMIQSADIGVGIAGKEGLQASRSSDYSIAQFRFLIKLLFVHGRYNYIRTSKFVLCTFYKEIAFYLTQLIYQRFTMFSGTSLYESWSLSVFNTMFTSLPVLCIGMFEKDLKPVTLLTVPELYTTGRLSQAFSLRIFLQWIILGTCNSLLITFLNVVAWGESSLSDNSLYPLGVINYTSLIFLINVKCQFIETHNRNWLAFASVIISCGGWLLWCCIIPRLQKNNKIYDVQHGLYEHFGDDITFYATILVLIALPVMVDIVIKTLIVMIHPSDTDIFARLEKRSEIRKKLEFGAYNEMKQGWTWERDPGTLTTYKNKVFSTRSRSSSTSSGKTEANIDNGRTRTNTTSTEEPDAGNVIRTESSSPTYDYDKYEMLPSGKLIKRQTSEEDTNSIGKSKDRMSSILPKKLRFTLKDENDEDIKAIIEQRMQDLE